MSEKIAVDALINYPYIPCLFVEDMNVTMYLCMPTELRNNDIILSNKEVQEILNKRGLFGRDPTSKRNKYFNNLVFRYEDFPGVKVHENISTYIRICSSTLFHFVWYKDIPRRERFFPTSRKDFVANSSDGIPPITFESTGNTISSFFDLNMYIIHSHLGYYSNIQFTNISVSEANEINLITRLQEEN
jgi:hypothetical protein